MKSFAGAEHLEATLDDGDVGCELCMSFAFDEMSEVMFKAAVDILYSGQMDALFEDGSVPSAVAEQPPPGSKDLRIVESMSVGHELYTKVRALTASDATKEFGKPPKTLQIKGTQIARRPRCVIVYPFIPTPERKLKYPTLKIFHQNSRGSQRNHCNNGAKQLFDGQAELLRGATGSSDSSACSSEDGSAFTFNFGFQSSIPTFAAIKDRRDSLNEKAKRRRGRISSGLVDGDEDGDSDDQHGDGPGGGPGHGHAASGASVEMLTDDGPERAPLPGQAALGAVCDVSGRTPSKRPPSVSSTPSLAQRSSKTPKPGSDDDLINPHTCGTVDYWVFGLRFDRAFNDFKNGRAENQAKILRGKVTGIERKSLGIHMDLYSKAKKFSPSTCKSETDEGLRKHWAELKKAGATLTTVALKGLANRYIDSIWKVISDPDTSIDKRKLYLQKLLSATAPWANLGDQSNASLDPCSVTLIKAAENDSEVADIFMDWVFSRALSDWLGAGSAAAENVLLSSSLTPDTTLDIFDGIDSIRSEAARTQGEQSVARIAGQALLPSCGGYWQKKIDWATTRTEAIKEHGGKLQTPHAKLIEIVVNVPPTRANGEFMLEVAKEISYWDARVYDGVSDDVKHTLLEKAVKSCAMLMNAGGVASAASPSQELQETPAVILHVFKAELARRLRDALHDCRARELPDDIREQCYKLFQIVVRGVIEDTRFGFMQQTDGAFYDTLETLAPHVPGNLSETCYKALSEAMDPPAEATPVDASTLERLAKELVRALQKQKQHMKAALLDEIKPSASTSVTEKMDHAKELAAHVGTSIVEKVRAALTDQMSGLNGAMVATPGFTESDEKAPAATSLDEVLNICTSTGLNDVSFGPWWTQCEDIDAKTDELAAKPGEFGVKVEAHHITEIETLVKGVRGFLLSAELCDCSLDKKSPADTRWGRGGG
ncbi:unnamed protein product [Prorocentrum cordatum]|uniref:Uncharacterized protein n=1 Tax=Prorocentrum cordatum TaxID=2364126 RepID=A0ABN9X331_9DINO|nr:unnamed protein product [Polarella glacialis]